MDTAKDTAQTAQSPPGQREERDCIACLGCGQVLEDVEVAYCWTETKAYTCPICKGTGSVSVYLYPGMRRSR